MHTQHNKIHTFTSVQAHSNPQTTPMATKCHIWTVLLLCAAAGQSLALDPNWCASGGLSALPTTLAPHAAACTSPAVLTRAGGFNASAPPSATDPRLLTFLYLADAVYIDPSKSAFEDSLECLVKTWGAAELPVYIEKELPSKLGLNGTVAAMVLHTTDSDVFVVYRGTTNDATWSYNDDIVQVDASKYYGADKPIMVHAGFHSVQQLLNGDIIQHIKDLRDSGKVCSTE